MKLIWKADKVKYSKKESFGKEEFQRAEFKDAKRSCTKLLNASNDTALRELSKLKSTGLIKQKAVGRGIYYVAE